VAASPIVTDAHEPDLERLLLDPPAIDAATLRWLRPRARNRPDLRLIAWRGERVVVKDWRAASLLLRPHARRCLAREWRALTALAGLPGVPRALARLPGAIVVSDLDGEPLAHQRLRHDTRQAFFAALLARVDQMHARGVAHLDLRQRRNVVCGADGQPGLLDFEAALVVDPARVWGRFALFWGRKVDRLAILKLKARYAPRLLMPQERRLARIMRASRWAWPSAVLHRLRVALRRLRRSAGS
jgi:predicted Ser/Thr protein kinase